MSQFHKPSKTMLSINLTHQRLKNYSTPFLVMMLMYLVSHLRHKNESKSRPLLISFDDVVARGTFLSHPGKLCNFDQYKNVYLAPDRTKMDQEKHQKLVSELRHRRSNSEQNLAIHNCVIVSVTCHPQPSVSNNSSLEKGIHCIQFQEGQP